MTHGSLATPAISSASCVGNDDYTDVKLLAHWPRADLGGVHEARHSAAAVL